MVNTDVILNGKLQLLGILFGVYIDVDSAGEDILEVLLRWS